MYFNLILIKSKERLRMRKHFLYTAVLFSLVPVTVFASSGLFPELQKKEEQPVSTETEEKFDIFDESEAIELNKNPEEEYQEVKEAELKEPIAKPEPKKESATDENDKKEEKDPVFEIHPHNIQIVTPPTGPNSQFCTGKITLENKSDYTLLQLKALFTYGGIKVPYAFANVGPNSSVTGSITLMGQPCQDLIRAVPVEAEICKAEGISDSECKSMVKYTLR